MTVEEPLRLGGAVFDTLTGHTGFVGGTLDARYAFGHRINSRNAEAMRGLRASGVICAGVYAEKWRANAEPEQDRAHIRDVFDRLSAIETDHFILISTVDVYDPPIALDETAALDPAATHPYGRHRLLLEEMVRTRFPRAKIIRLPGLFGPGMKKNFIFDLMHRRRGEFIPPNSQLQWFDIRRLVPFLEMMFTHGIDLLNVVTEPVATSALRDVIAPDYPIAEADSKAPRYDVRSCYSGAFGRSDGYLQGAETVLRDLGGFVREYAKA